MNYELRQRISSTRIPKWDNSTIALNGIKSMPRRGLLWIWTLWSKTSKTWFWPRLNGGGRSMPTCSLSMSIFRCGWRRLMRFIQSWKRNSGSSRKTQKSRWPWSIVICGCRLLRMKQAKLTRKVLGWLGCASEVSWLVRISTFKAKMWFG